MNLPKSDGCDSKVAPIREPSPLFCARCGAAFGSVERKVSHRCEQVASVRRRHWHADHVDAPARNSQREALKDARRLGVPVGPQYASIVLCYRAECVGAESADKRRRDS